MLALLILVISVLLDRSALAHDPAGQKAQLEAVRIEERLGGQLPLDTVWRDETGQTVPLRHYFNGTPVLLAFVYYDCPQLCPLVLEGLARSARALRLAGDNYQVVAISIDPAETPALAAAKKLRMKASPDWHFLTGAPAAIAALTEAAGVRYEKTANAGKEEFIHPANTIVASPQGKISRYFSAIDFPPRDLRYALIEASGNRIGSPLDQLLMLCYRYDPAQGRYTLAILNTLRGAAVLTLLALAGFIGFMLLREREAA